MAWTHCQAQGVFLDNTVQKFTRLLTNSVLQLCSSYANGKSVLSRPAARYLDGFSSCR